MTHIERTLMDGEHVVFLTHKSLWAYHLEVVSGLALTAALIWAARAWQLPPWWAWVVVAITAGGAVLGYVLIAAHATELGVTNRRVIVKRGIIARQTQELYLGRVEGVDVTQSVAGRLMGFGDVFIRGVGAEGTFVRGVEGPARFRAAFLEAAYRYVKGQDRGGAPVSIVRQYSEQQQTPH